MARVEDKSAWKGVWVFAEQRQGELNSVAIELLGEGKKLADDIGTELCAVVIGENVGDIATELGKYGADKVYVADAPILKNYTTDAYTQVICDAMRSSFWVLPTSGVTLVPVWQKGLPRDLRLTVRIWTLIRTNTWDTFPRLPRQSLPRHAWMQTRTILK